MPNKIITKNESKILQLKKRNARLRELNDSYISQMDELKAECKSTKSKVAGLQKEIENLKKEIKQHKIAYTVVSSSSKAIRSIAEDYEKEITELKVEKGNEHKGRI